MSKRWYSAILALILLFTLASCGDGGSATTAATSAENGQTTSVDSTAATTVETTAATTVETTAETTAQTTESGSDSGEGVPVRVLALKGPTAIGMVDLMERAELGEAGAKDFSFVIAAAPDEASAAIAKGEVDIAAVPANMAAALYKKTNQSIQVLGINTLGVLYICGADESVKTISDLEGRTVYASGKGATPEYALAYLLEKNGVQAQIEWKSEHSESVAALAADPQALAMLPQPFVSGVQLKNPDIKVLVDLTAEWDAVQTAEGGKSTLVTGVVVVRREFLEAHPEQVASFLELYAKSVEAVRANTEDIAQLVEKHGIVPAKVAQAAIPQCNIVLITGEEMAETLSAYLEILHAQNPKAVGGELPDEGFYFIP